MQAALAFQTIVFISNPAVSGEKSALLHLMEAADFALRSKQQRYFPKRARDRVIQLAILYYANE